MWWHCGGGDFDVTDASNFPFWELEDSPRMTASSKAKFNLNCNYIIVLHIAVNSHPLRYKRGSVNPYPADVENMVSS
jgi:hypothetical protein